MTPNSKPQAFVFKGPGVKTEDFVLNERSAVEIKTHTTDNTSALSTITVDGSSKTAPSQVNIKRTTLAAGSHEIAIASSAKATFYVNITATAVSRFESFKSLFRGFF